MDRTPKKRASAPASHNSSSASSLNSSRDSGNSSPRTISASSLPELKSRRPSLLPSLGGPSPALPSQGFASHAHHNDTIENAPGYKGFRARTDSARRRSADATNALANLAAAAIKTRFPKI